MRPHPYDTLADQKPAELRGDGHNGGPALEDPYAELSPGTLVYMRGVGRRHGIIIAEFVRYHAGIARVRKQKPGRPLEYSDHTSPMFREDFMGRFSYDRDI